MIFKPLFMINLAELVYDTLLVERYSGRSGALYLNIICTGGNGCNMFNNVGSSFNPI